MYELIVPPTVVTVWKSHDRGGGLYGPKIVTDGLVDTLVQPSPETDQAGALAQHVIVYSRVGGWTRESLTKHFYLSERTIQEYMSGRRYVQYTQPIIKILNSMGIDTRYRGTWKQRLTTLVKQQQRIIDQIYSLQADEDTVTRHRILSVGVKAFFDPRYGACAQQPLPVPDADLADSSTTSVSSAAKR